jgi:hypothetical protein
MHALQKRQLRRYQNPGMLHSAGLFKTLLLHFTLVPVLLLTQGFVLAHKLLQPCVRVAQRRFLQVAEQHLILLFVV